MFLFIHELIKMEFDEGLDRKGTNSAKHDFIEDCFDKNNLLPMWVADSDWSTSEAIIDALEERIQHGALGYTRPGEEHDRAVVDWLQRRYNWDIDPEWIVYTNGITPSLSISVRTFADTGDDVVIQTPVYFPFFSIVENSGCRVLENKLQYDKEEKRYSIDFDDLEDKFCRCEISIGQKKRTSMMILCNPHNPVGRVWTEDELKRIADLALEKDILVVSDEIFSDYVYDDKHIPFSSVTEEIEQNSITMIAPTKTFNIAGLNIGLAIIPNENLRKRFEDAKEGIVKRGNLFGFTAIKAAYDESEGWLDRQLAYLKENRDFAVSFIRKKIPDVDVVKPEGTFLLWIDFNDLGLGSEELEKLMIEEAEVALNNGIWFGENGEGFMRLNFACPRSTLKEGLTRIRNAVEGLK